MSRKGRKEANRVSAEDLLTADALPTTNFGEENLKENENLKNLYQALTIFLTVLLKIFSG